LFRATPINEQILKHGRNEINLEVAKYVNKCIKGLDIEISNYTLQILIEDIIDKYKFDSIEDIQVCLKNGRQGRYGTTYNKLNMVIISDWMSKHLEEKAIYREKIINDRKKESDFKGWETREDYEKAARKPTPMSFKDRIRQKDEEYQKFKADYEAKKIKK
jgi:hypothetical protein